MAFVKNDSSTLLIGTSLDDTLDGVNVLGQWLGGGLGNDTYILALPDGFVPLDSIVENAGEGTDSVVLLSLGNNLDYALNANVENLTLMAGAASQSLLTGNDSNNVIAIFTGVHTIDGGKGSDTVIVNNSAVEAVYVDSATDIVTVNGSGSVLEILSTALTYTISAGVSNLTLTGSGNINGTGNALTNVIVGNTGNNIIDGGLGNDILNGGDGNDTLLGNLGDDTLDGGAGSDNLQGGAGNDLYVNVQAGDVVGELAAAGSDTIYTALTAFSLVDTDGAGANGGNVENLVLTGGSMLAGQIGTGNALDNFIQGSAFDDIVYGGAGNDTLDAAMGADRMYGGAGNDIFVIDDEADRAFEAFNEGSDTVYSTVEFMLGANVENLVLLGDEDLAGGGNALNNSITGGSGDDWLIGGDGNDILNGGGGNDEMFGGKGNDTYYNDSSSASGQDHMQELFNEGIDLVLSSLNLRSLNGNIENLTLLGTADLAGGGNALNNIITGNAGHNVLSGNGGNDMLVGGLGNDTYSVDSSGDAVSELAAQGTDTVVFSGGPSYSLMDTDGAGANGGNVENLILDAGAGNISGTGNALDNVITGNAGLNIIDGGAGNDVLYGGSGSDVLYGGLGNDFMNGGDGDDVAYGGAGNDTYQVSSMGDIVDELALAGAGIDTVNTFLRVTDIVISITNPNFKGVIENITLQASAVDAYGNAAANVITGNAGVNRLEGRAGNDTYFADLRDTVVETSALATELDTLNLDVGSATGSIDMATRYANIENLTLLGTGNYDVTGTAAANILVGNSGHNVLYGGAGIDQMRGGAGDDTYQVDVAGDVVTELANEGIDQVQSQIAYTLGLNLENLLLTGGGAIGGTGNALNNVIRGGNGNNTLSGLDGNDELYGHSGNDILLGGNGNDHMDGGAGNDAMTGALGDDTYVVRAAGDTVIEIAAQGNDSVIVNFDGFALAATANVESLIAYGGTADLDFNGNALDNLLVGNGGDNMLAGGGGNDTFDGGLGGNDSFTGGAGIDTFNFKTVGSLNGGDILVGALGSSDVVNAVLGNLGLDGAPVMLNASGIEIFNLIAAASGAEGSFVDVTSVGGNNGIAINATTAEGSGAHLALYDLTGLTSLEVPGGTSLNLNDYYGGAGSWFAARLSDASGVNDGLRINLNGVETTIDTLGIETVLLNVAGGGSQAFNEVTAEFSGADQIAITGGAGYGLDLLGLDEALLAAEALEIVVFNYAGYVLLGLGDNSGLSDEVTVTVDNFFGVLEMNGVENIRIDSSFGDLNSRIQLAGSGLQTLVLVGDSNLTINPTEAATVDATAFAGATLRVRSTAANGTDFTFGKAGVAVNVDGSGISGASSDTFTFDLDGGVATLGTEDRVDGRLGTDAVTAAIDGLQAGTTGAPEFVSIEAVNFSNNTSGVGTVRGASIDATNFNVGSFYTLNLTGSGTIDGALDTELLNFKGGLNAGGYSGDVRINAGGNSFARTYTVGEGNHQINGSTTEGTRDTFNFSSIDSLDRVQGYDINNASGGDVLNATVTGLTADLVLHTGTGALDIRGIETINLATAGSASTLDATRIDHAYTFNFSGNQNLTMAGFDATGIVFNASTTTGGAWVNITGGDGNDTFTGGGGADTFAGGAGIDTINTSNGLDTLLGGAGNDIFNYKPGMTGQDIIDGGGPSLYGLEAGRDTLSLTQWGGTPGVAGLTVTLTGLTLAQGGVDGTIVDGALTTLLRNIDSVLGTAGDDTMTGSFNASLWLVPDATTETFRGGAGNDVISGGGAGAESSKVNWGYSDRADYQNSPTGVSVYLGTAGSITDGDGNIVAAGTARDGWGNIDTLTYIDQVRGSAFDDWIVGGSESRGFGGSRQEVFFGGAGNDYIAGGATFSASDNDRVDYSLDPSAVVVNLGTGVAYDGYGGIDTLFDINQVRGSEFADRLYGGNVLNDANETFEGGGGDDAIDGRTGMDIASYQGANITIGQTGVTVNLVTGIATGFSVGTDSLLNVEGVFGSDGNDTITGGSTTWTFERLRGNGGDDVIDGGAGIDEADYFNDVDSTNLANQDGWGVLVNLGGTALSQAAISARTVVPTTWDDSVLGLAANRAIDGWGTIDTLLNMEDVRGSRFDDWIIGNSGANKLAGRAGSDILTGGAGADSFLFDVGPIGPAANDNVDTITDFVVGSDELLLDDSVFSAIGLVGAMGAGDARFETGAGLTAAATAAGRIVYNETTGNLYYDSNGSTAGGSTLFATLEGGVALVSTDITVV